MQQSIEAEYWVIDRDGALVRPGALTDVSEYTEQEFVGPLFELKTPPCETSADLRRTFVDQLTTVLARAEDLDRHLVPLETPLNGERIELRPGERGRIQRQVVGPAFEHAKYCAGTHVHFEKRNVRDQLNVLTALDPALALLNSAPYYRGRRVAAGARSHVYRTETYAQLPRHGRLWDYVDTVGEWTRRLDDRFEEFLAAAARRGVDRDRVRAEFCRDDAVWTPVRLRDAMPTVEWRSPPTALPSQVLRVVETVADLVSGLADTTVDVTDGPGQVTDDGVELPAFDRLSDYADRAIRDGVESSAVTGYLRRMGFDAAAHDPLSGAVDGGPRVSRARARRLRLRYGRLMRRDVAGLRRERGARRSRPRPNGAA